MDIKDTPEYKGAEAIINKAEARRSNKFQHYVVINLLSNTEAKEMIVDLQKQYDNLTPPKHNRDAANQHTLSAIDNPLKRTNSNVSNILWSGAQLKQELVKAFFKACKKAETEKGVEVTFMFEEMADVAMNLIEKPLLDKIAELEKLLKEAQAQ